MTNVNGVNSAGYQIKVYPIVPTARVANDLANRQQPGYQDSRSRRKLPEQDDVEISQDAMKMQGRIPVKYSPEYSDAVIVINDDSVRER